MYRETNVFRREKTQCGSSRLFATRGLPFASSWYPQRLRVVFVVIRVESAEHAVLEVERLVAEEEGVRVGDDVILVVELVDDDVVDHRVLERCVGAGPDARVHVGRRRGSGVARIDVDDLRAVFLGLPNPLEGHGVVLGDVAAFHQDRLAVLQVDPVVGHRSSTERGPQTGDRGAMSKPGLVLDVDQAEQPGRFLEEVALLVGVLRAAHEADRVGPIDRNFLVADLLGGDPGLVARLSDFLRDPRFTASCQEMSSQWSLPGAR